MKRILSVGILLFAFQFSNGQYNNIPMPMPCIEINNTNFPNGHTQIENYGCIEGPTSVNNVNVSGVKQVDFISGTEVHLNPGFKAHGFTGSGYFHAGLEQSQIPLVLFSPNSSNGEVGRYEKLEVGVRLPQTVYDQIDNFVNEIPSTTWLNPFNEGEINVIAEFYYMTNLSTGTLEHTIYGYYHNEYNRVIVAPPNEVNSHYERDTTSFRFRVRFAPDRLGYWTCKIRAQVNGVGVLYAQEFIFKCVNSSTHGFMTQGDNNYFFEIDNHTYIPMGQNLTWPKCDKDGNCGQYGTIPDEMNGSGYQTYLNNPVTYLYYQDKMEAMKNAGADFFRIMFAPWSMDLEFEKPGNYTSPNLAKDRLHCAWEMDQIVDKAKDLGINFTLNTEVHTAFEVPNSYGAYEWDWTDEHCGIPDQPNGYRTALGLQDPVEFFTNQQAQKYYKQKLRYIISRWGYSTNLAMIEFISEINNVGKEYPVDPQYDQGGNLIGCPPTPAEDNYSRYENDPAYPVAVQNWHASMSDYVKNTLGHKQHLLSTSYTGGNRLGVDNSYYLTNIDVANYNFYPINPTRYNDVSSHNGNSEELIQKIHNTGNKPVMFSESGAPSLDECSNFTEWKKNAWVSPFLGVAASLNWSGFDKSQFEYLWTEYGKIKDFIDGIEFDNENWAPVENLRGDNKASLFALKKPSNNNQYKAIGVIVNNTWNYWTESIGGDCSDPDNDVGNGLNSHSVLHQYSVNNSNELHLTDMGKLKQYVIEFQHETGTSIITRTSSAIGKLNIEYPIAWEATNEEAIVRFKVYRSNSSFLMEPILEGENEVNELELGSLGEETVLSHERTGLSAEISILPNPASSMCVLTIPIELSKNNCLLEIYNSIGQLKNTITINSLVTNIPLSGYENGIYLFKIKGENEGFVRKIIINEN